jgi:hypothetical protein
MLKEFRESFGLIGAEPDYGAWLAPRLFERIPYVTNHWLGRRFRHALERSPSLPCRFQARSCVLRARDQLWITHRAPSPESILPGRIRTGPSVTRAASAPR